MEDIKWNGLPHITEIWLKVALNTIN
jgi:hypothetical protein